MTTYADPTNQVPIARAIAHIAHRGQVDKAGNAYIDHPRRVAGRLGGQSANTVAMAWLHDVLEDTDITREDLKAAGVDFRVINGVEVLSQKRGLSNADYYEAINASTSARLVKLADIEDNTDPQRLALLDDETIVRLTRKYAKAREALGVK